MKRGFVVFILWIVFGLNLTGQNEKLSYHVYYNWGFIWIDAGTLTLTSRPDTLNNVSVVRLDGMGKSLPRWNWLYKLNDHYSSWCYPGSFIPVKATKNTMEGGYVVDRRYDFNFKDSALVIHYSENNLPVTIDTLALTGDLFDAQSATARLRYLDLSNYKPGDTIVLPIVMDDVVYTQNIVYKGVDTLRLKNEQQIRAYRFSTVVTGNRLFSTTDDINVWISADKHRTPLYIEAGITIGSIKILYDDSYSQMR